jgi:dUTPase
MGKNDQGKVTESINELDLEPQGIAVVVSRETLKLPADVCGHALVKTSLCREGVLAMSIGIIDPNWEGPISSILLNFGKKAYRLRKGDPFLRVTFHPLEQESGKSAGSAEVIAKPILTEPQIAAIRSKYLALAKEKFESRVAGSFLDYSSLTWTAARKFFLPLLPAAGAITLALAFVTFLLNFGVLALANRTMPQDVAFAKAQVLTADIKQDNQKLHEENSRLQEELRELRAQLDEITKSQRQKKQ